MDDGLINLPEDILVMIFKRMSQEQLMKLASLSPRIEEILLNNAYLFKNFTFDYSGKRSFESLYSGPHPVREVNLGDCHVSPPIHSSTDKKSSAPVEVTKLDLTAIKTDVKTTEAIMTKYTCKELILDNNAFSTIAIPPSTFSKHPRLELLSLRHNNGQDTVTLCCCVTPEVGNNNPQFNVWLKESLNHCSGLKVLDLYGNRGFSSEGDGAFVSLVENSPKTLEKLNLLYLPPMKDEHFESLAKSSPDLRDLQLNASYLLKPATPLVKFKRLETLRLYFCSANLHDIPISGALNQFVGLKKVYCFMYQLYDRFHLIFKKHLHELELILKRSGIQVINGHLEENRN